MLHKLYKNNPSLYIIKHITMSIYANYIYRSCWYIRETINMNEKYEYDDPRSPWKAKRFVFVSSASRLYSNKLASLYHHLCDIDWCSHLRLAWANRLRVGDIGLRGVCKRPNYHPRKYLFFVQRMAQLYDNILRK